MNTTIDPTATVGQLVRENPARARVFEDLGVDYCCGGKKPLEDACREKGLDVNEVVGQLDADDRGETRLADAQAMSLTELVDHIQSTHHEYLRRELPRIARLLEKVVAAHGQRHPKIAQIPPIFAAFDEELRMHMMKEERILFPAIRELDRPDGARQFHCGSLSNPIRVMEAEHDSAGEAMAQFRSLSDDYSTPDDVCNTYRALMDALHDLELDMHQHVHKENNVLFPRVIETEANCA